ncbi:conserved hypothetical protein, partial [Perkinsus marinus ATCC 50983]
LGRIIGYSVANGVLPSTWKHSKVILLDKPNRDRKSVKSLRPISLCPSISKIAESYVRKDLRESMYSLSFAGRQHAYIEGKSSLEVVGSSVKWIASRRRWAILSLDFSNAFGEIGHDSIMSSLEKLRVADRTRKWIHRWLSQRTAEVHYGSEVVTRECFPGKGTPQGALLSPWIFVLGTESIGEATE